MKASLRFDLSDEQDKYEFYHATRSIHYVLALEEICEQIRRWRKYEERESIPIEEIAQKIHEIINENKADTESP